MSKEYTKSLPYAEDVCECCENRNECEIFNKKLQLSENNIIKE
jgi:hypothetical protein